MSSATKYDPRIYGEFGAEFLQKLDKNNSYISNSNAENNIEDIRQQMIKDIIEGRLKPVQP